MYRLKLLIILAFGICFAVSCLDSKPQRYSITDSKSYDASLFRQNCAICHGPEGEGKTLEDGKQIPNLRQPPFKYNTDEQIYNHIAEGGNGMTPFRGQLTEREINLMVRFVQDELRSDAGDR